MKTTLLILIVLLPPYKKYWCKLETTNCYTQQKDTVFMIVRGGLCIASYKEDSVKRLIDKTERIIKDSVCDYRILYSSDKYFDPF